MCVVAADSIDLAHYPQYTHSDIGLAAALSGDTFCSLKSNFYHQTSYASRLSISPPTPPHTYLLYDRLPVQLLLRHHRCTLCQLADLVAVLHPSDPRRRHPAQALQRAEHRPHQRAAAGVAAAHQQGLHHRAAVAQRLEIERARAQHHQRQLQRLRVPSAQPQQRAGLDQLQPNPSPSHAAQPHHRTRSVSTVATHKHHTQHEPAGTKGPPRAGKQAS
jgi:hypothetical protein